MGGQTNGQTNGQTDKEMDRQMDGQMDKTSQRCVVISKNGKCQKNLHLGTVKPRNCAPTFDIIPLIKHTNFGCKKCVNNYLNVGNKANLDIKHNSDQSLEMRYTGFQLYMYFCFEASKSNGVVQCAQGVAHHAEGISRHANGVLHHTDGVPPHLTCHTLFARQLMHDSLSGCNCRGFVEIGVI